jgi:hypothetical protein
VQLTQALEPSDLPQRAEFAASMLDSIEQDNQYLQRVMFSDEATFYVSGHVNRHNVRIWDSENPHVIREHVRASPKLSVCCALTHDKVIGLFVFAEDTVTGANYYDMIHEYLLP